MCDLCFLVLSNTILLLKTGFSGSSAGKDSAYNAGDPGSIPGLGRSAGEGIGYPLQYSWASHVAQLVKNLPVMQADLGLIPGLGRSGFLDSSVGKESACNAGDPGSVPGLGRSAGEGIGHPLQYPWASLVAQLVTNLPAMWETWVQSLGWQDPLEKRTAAHSSILAWKSQSMGSQRVRLSDFHFSLTI